MHVNRDAETIQAVAESFAQAFQERFFPRPSGDERGLPLLARELHELLTLRRREEPLRDHSVVIAALQHLDVDANRTSVVYREKCQAISVREIELR